mmetsp:Transcript_78504/g.138714  ORF Transcript_78504/g.138714 Transcript_78504/m.138714 type:complete len:107 (-) Transcript_78504:1449-1769(-)
MNKKLPSHCTPKLGAHWQCTQATLKGLNTPQKNNGLIGLGIVCLSAPSTFETAGTLFGFGGYALQSLPSPSMCFMRTSPRNRPHAWHFTPLELYSGPLPLQSSVLT